MGCSAAKNLTVEQLDTANNNGAVEEPRKASVPRRVSDVPAIVGVEPQTELLDVENANVNNVQATGESENLIPVSFSIHNFFLLTKSQIEDLTN